MEGLGDYLFCLIEEIVDQPRKLLNVLLALFVHYRVDKLADTFYEVDGARMPHFLDKFAKTESARFYGGILRCWGPWSGLLCERDS